MSIFKVSILNNSFLKKLNFLLFNFESFELKNLEFLIYLYRIVQIHELDEFKLL